jgi:YjbE family integral membrane protein
MIEYFSSPAFWVGLGQIIVVNILLSGDNAVVIALAARSLPPHQQKKAIIWGSVAAIVMRVILTIVAVKLLTMPYLKIVGGLLLFWIAIQLLLSEDDGGEGIESSNNVWVAIRTILIADLVMSLDNVIGVAAAAKGDDVLVILGLAISIPLIIFGSTILLKLMDRFPIIITGGAALLGWVGRRDADHGSRNRRLDHGEYAMDGNTFAGSGGDKLGADTRRRVCRRGWQADVDAQ